ncbi:MAG TPA: hypothetical protein VFM76_06300 [Methylophaga sp.]|nr:hypothetical protein [Methylophaga sp.]
MSLLQLGCHNHPYSQTAITPIRLQQNLHDSWQLSHRNFIGFPSPQAFSICHSMTCHSVSDVSLSRSQWQRVRRHFEPVAQNAEAERQQIAAAIALLEKLVGNHTGTVGDQAKNHLLSSRHGQLDCIDEATNSAVYLRIMDTQGLLSWHQAAPRTSRGPLTGQAPHNTASIIETQSQQRYAVDSWFFANGQPPAIVLMDLWKQGWQPPSLEN